MIDPTLRGAVQSLFASTCDHDAIQAAEHAGWAPDVWSGAAEMGLPWIGLDETDGGSGGTLSDALEVLRLAGEHAAPIPLAETGLLAGWLMAGAGVAASIDDQPMSVVPGHRNDTLSISGGRVSGTAYRVPWARAVPKLVALVDTDQGWMVAVLATAALTVEPIANLAGEPRDTVRADAVEPLVLAPAGPGIDGTALRYRGALTRVALMAGALERMNATTQRYTQERRQFGKPVGTFQAVQQHLVVCAQETAMVGMAASIAMLAAERGDARYEIAAAKVVAGQAAGTATRAAHQAHGAMGMTQEYSLHQVSRRLWSWRGEYGGQKWWSREAGAMAFEAGADRLYPLISGGTVELRAGRA